jgi:post-segregation antitoxin (ccd killing protein)
MSDVEITIKLPEELLEQAKAGGVPITGASVASMIEAELIRAQAVNRLRETMRKLEGSLSSEEMRAN